MTNKFQISGFHCESCIKLTKAMLSDIPGVKEVTIQGLDGETRIESDEPVTVGELQEALKDTGYIVKEKV